MTFRVVLDHDSETGDYSAVCPELPGCASAGETEEEARANIREAIELYLSLARRIRD
jgi:predicted RNase H-like HicB family nuclease